MNNKQQTAKRVKVSLPFDTQIIQRGDEDEKIHHASFHIRIEGEDGAERSHSFVIGSFDNDEGLLKSDVELIDDFGIDQIFVELKEDGFHLTTEERREARRQLNKMRNSLTWYRSTENGTERIRD